MEEEDEILDGNYKSRSDAIHKCFVATRNQYDTVYAVSNGGSCQGFSNRSYRKYMKQGRSTKCAKDGKGGPGASQIYRHISKWIVYNIEYIYMFIYLSIHLYLSIYLSTYLSICLSIYMCVYVCMCLQTCGHHNLHLTTVTIKANCLVIRHCWLAAWWHSPLITIVFKNRFW